VARRSRLVAGNWKMNGSRASNAALLEALVAPLGREADVQVAVCPPFPYLEQVGGRLAATRVA
jgi:triosephosphate isomerase (TIM)